MSKLWSAVFSGRMLLMFLNGFSSGLPLLLTGGTLRAWLRQEHVDLTLIGIFAFVGLPYTLKFLWAPIFDRFTPPFLGRRRGWLLITQVGLVGSLIYLGFYPMSKLSTATLGFRALLVAFFSASQDIVIDAYRREILADKEIGLGSALTINGYRVGMLVAGGVALALVDGFKSHPFYENLNAWTCVYFVMAMIMVIGIFITLFSPEPVVEVRAPQSFKEAIVEPFLDFFNRKTVWMILAFILFYKIGDSMVSDMLNPFYIDLGFSLTQIGVVAKTAGLWSGILGGTVGGILILRMGLYRSLWVFGVLQSISILGFWVLCQSGANIWVLVSAIVFEVFTSGLGTAAFVGFMASLTNKKYTATQYALLSSVMGIPRVFVGMSTGYLAKTLGWGSFFMLCAVMGVPGLILLWRLKYNKLHFAS